MNKPESEVSLVQPHLSKMALYASFVLIALLYALSGVSWAATAVDDFYSIDAQGGSEDLIVIYNDRIDISTVELIEQVRITSLSDLSDPSAGTITLQSSEGIEVGNDVIGEGQVFEVRYTPNPSFSGVVTFDYVLEDARGSSTATVTLTVTSDSSFLQVVDDKFTSAGESVFIYPLENDIFPEGNPAVAIQNQPDSGSVEADGAIEGLFIYTPPENVEEAFTTSFNYTVTLEDSTTGTGTVSILVDPSIDPISGGVIDEEERDLATVLQTACDINTLEENSDEVFADTCTELASLGLDERSEALEAILLRQVGAQSTSLQDQAQGQMKMVGSRIQALRSGVTGFSFNGLNALIAGEQVAVGKIIDGYISGAGAGDETSGGRLGMFVTGTLEMGDGESRGKESGFEYDSQQLMAGVDYRFSRTTVLGVALGFDSTETTEDGADTKLENDGWTASLYGNYYPADNWYLDWIIGYGQSSIDTSRGITIGTIESTSDGSTHGSHSSIAVGGGYSWQVDAWSIDAFANMDYSTSIVDGYEEDNDAGLALKISETSTDTGAIRLGARASNAMSFDFGVLIPQFEMDFVNEFKSEAPTIEAELVSSPESGTFVVNNEDPDDGYGNVGVSLTALFKNGFSGFVRYGTQFSKDDVSIDTWQAGARWELGGPAQDIELFKSRENQGIGGDLFLGTTGIGVAVTVPVNNEYVNLRGIATTLDYDTDDTLDDVDYDINLELGTFGMLVDWHPFGGGFRMSGGFFAMNNEFSGEAVPTEPVEIGNSTFTPEQVGTLNADIGYGNSFSPYIGIGWGNAVQPGSNWSISADIGVMFTDNPTIELSADSPLADSNPALKAQLLAELENEEDNINEDDLSDVDFWPVITFGFSYHF